MKLEFGPHDLTEEALTVDYGYVFFRRVMNDMSVTNWKPIIDFDGRTFKELKDYLRTTYHGADPELRWAPHFGHLAGIILEDRHRYQYFGVEAIPKNKTKDGFICE